MGEGRWPESTTEAVFSQEEDRHAASFQPVGFGKELAANEPMRSLIVMTVVYTMSGFLPRVAGEQEEQPAPSGWRRVDEPKEQPPPAAPHSPSAPAPP